MELDAVVRGHAAGPGDVSVVLVDGVVLAVDVDAGLGRAQQDGGDADLAALEVGVLAPW